MCSFVKLQQKIIDREMLEMPPKEVNEILRTMKAEEAFDFLGHLGQIRAAIIYSHLTEVKAVSQRSEAINHRAVPLHRWTSKEVWG